MVCPNDPSEQKVMAQQQQTPQDAFAWFPGLAQFAPNSGVQSNPGYGVEERPCETSAPSEVQAACWNVDQFLGTPSPPSESRVPQRGPRTYSLYNSVIQHFLSPQTITPPVPAKSRRMQTKMLTNSGDVRYRLSAGGDA